MNAYALEIGRRMHAQIGALYPTIRSITGDGVRATLSVIAERLPLTVHEVPSGTAVLDWTVPDEWNIRDAWIANARGERVVDLSASSLHVVSYSEPVRARVSRQELERHLHSLPSLPDAIPYRTSYYTRDWGFCVSDRVRQQLVDSEFDVCIDSTLAAGSLTYGELFIPGASRDEVLLSAHICHPALANDNLSGVVLAAAVAEWITSAPRRRSYRILLAPGTIGAITWLSRNRELLGHVVGGLVLSCTGDAGPITYKRSRIGDTLVDRAAMHVFAAEGRADRVRDFAPTGYDERQFCSPGFNLPVGSFSRTPHGEYPEYHTSLDNLEFISIEALAHSFGTVTRILGILDSERAPINRLPFGEPQLGRRGLYDLALGEASVQESRLAMLWVLSLSDGDTSLLRIAERSGLSFDLVRAAAEQLARSGVVDDRY